MIQGILTCNQAGSTPVHCTGYWTASRVGSKSARESLRDLGRAGDTGQPVYPAQTECRPAPGRAPTARDSGPVLGRVRLCYDRAATLLDNATAEERGGGEPAVARGPWRWDRLVYGTFWTVARSAHRARTLNATSCSSAMCWSVTCVRSWCMQGLRIAA